MRRTFRTRREEAQVQSYERRIRGVSHARENKSFSECPGNLVRYTDALGLAGCNKNSSQDSSTQAPPAETQTDQSQDPAAVANLAPASAYQPAG